MMATTSVVAAERVALVIGNAAYQHAPHLSNPRNDAKAIAAAFSNLGYEITQVYDADLNTLQNRLKTFGRQARRAESVLVYFAGHGMEVGRHNYLLPVDARLEYAADIAFEAIQLDNLLKQISTAHGHRLVILDACRDNPLATQMQRTDGTRSTSYRGLGRIEPSHQTYVAYASKHGSRALDNDPNHSGHSPFAASLLAHINKPLPLERLFGSIREDVLARTNNTQEPWLYGAVGSQPIYLVKPDRQQRKRAILTVKSQPDHARVRIVGHDQPYQHGIRLDPGKYTIEVTAPGYANYSDEYQLTAGVQRLAIVLPPRVAPTQPPTQPQQEPDALPASQAYLSVTTQPANARVRIMNIVPRYHDGIALEPGRYSIEVSTPGYQTYKKWHLLDAGERSLQITLKKSPPSKRRYFDSNGCLRESNGTFVLGFRADCKP